MPQDESITVRKLKESFAESILSVLTLKQEDTVTVHAENIYDILKLLKEDSMLRYDFCRDITAVDFPKDKLRFEVVYHLYSHTYNHRIRIKARLSENSPTIHSSCGLWKSANWLERECYDMYGITFTEHPDLRRILLYEEFQGYPLRKDYPVTKRQPLVSPVN